MVQSVCKEYCLRLTEKSIERISFHLEGKRDQLLSLDHFVCTCECIFPFWALTDQEREK